MEAWRSVFEQHGAIWMHGGKAEQPHALLTSGLHSDGFVNCSLVTQNASLLGLIARHNGIGEYLPKSKEVDWIIGSAMGAVTFAHAIGAELGVKAGFTEKDGDYMKLARFEVKSDEKVLVVEDTISTGGSTLKTIAGIMKAGVPAENILPYIVCLVNRSGSDKLGDREIRALLTLNIHSWIAEECPLCNAGSEAVRPKANWKELTAKY